PLAVAHRHHHFALDDGNGPKLFFNGIAAGNGGSILRPALSLGQRSQDRNQGAAQNRRTRQLHSSKHFGLTFGDSWEESDPVQKLYRRQQPESMAQSNPYSGLENRGDCSLMRMHPDETGTRPT